MHEAACTGSNTVILQENDYIEMHFDIIDGTL